MSLEDLFKFGRLEKHKTSSQEIADLFGVAERCPLSMHPRTPFH